MYLPRHRNYFNKIAPLRQVLNNTRTINLDLVPQDDFQRTRRVIELAKGKSIGGIEEAGGACLAGQVHCTLEGGALRDSAVNYQLSGR